MNDTIPPLACKIVQWLRAIDTVTLNDDHCEREVAHLIASHVPIDAMVRERTAYRDLLRLIYHAEEQGRWICEDIAATFKQHGESLSYD